jgi:hypothetical protein
MINRPLDLDRWKHKQTITWGVQQYREQAIDSIETRLDIPVHHFPASANHSVWVRCGRRGSRHELKG